MIAVVYTLLKCVLFVFLATFMYISTTDVTFKIGSSYLWRTIIISVITWLVCASLIILTVVEVASVWRS